MSKTKVGVVISDKMQKTCVVKFMKYVRHPLYRKYVRKMTKVYVHDEKNECKAGDKVIIEQTRPLSRLKRWRLVRKIS